MNKYKRLDKYYRRHNNSNKLPRKTKKLLLGRKLNKSKLRKRIASIKILTASLENGYSWSVPSECFCPYCGCDSARTGPMLAGYPEVYYYSYCLRCNRAVGCADNSQFIHFLCEILREERGL